MIVPRPETLGELLKEQYEAYQGDVNADRRINQTKVADSTGISQPQLSRLMNGRADFNRLLPSQLLALLTGFNFTRQEIAEIARDYDLPELVKWLELEDRASGASALKRVRKGPTVRYFGPTNAGLDLARLAAEGEEVFVPDWIADRFELSRVFAMDVVGDSMACDDVMRSIPEGSRVYFLESKTAQAGETVCCRLHRDGLHVIKVYKPQEGYAILESYNHEHKPIVVDADNPGDIVGVYLTHIPRGPRLR